MKNLLSSAFILLISTLIEARPSEASGQSPAERSSLSSRTGEIHNGILDGPFLRLLGRIEGPDGYGTITHATHLRPPAPLVSMTVEEVLHFQKKIRASGARSSAVGRYQFIHKTLNHYVKEGKIDPDLPFDRYTQDTLARLEMRRCGFYDMIASDKEVANCLAAVWAALPLVTGPNKGKSRYHGKAGNAALVSPAEMMAVMSLRFQPVYESRYLARYR